MAVNNQLTLLYQVAKSYYVDKLTQSQISEMVHISRSQISRLLTKAEQLGIVTITVTMPENPEYGELEETLQEILGLDKVVIAPLTGKAPERSTIADAIATEAAFYIGKELKDCKVIGLGWGRTMYNLALRVGYRNMGEDRRYVPLVGLSGTTSPYLQVNTIVDRMAERHGARGIYVSQPAYFHARKSLSAQDKRQMDLLQEYWSRLDAAIIGLGDSPAGGVVYADEVDEFIAEDMLSTGVVGDILTYYFRPDGSIYYYDEEHKHFAFHPSRLPKLRKVICLAGGSEKLEGIIAGAKLHFYNQLVTDSVTARMLYDRYREK